MLTSVCHMESRFDWCHAAFLFAAALMLISCGGNRSGEVLISGLNPETVCVISQEDHSIGNLNSLDVMEDGRFLLSTDNEVLLFDAGGKLLREIGKSGRASGEYSMPMAVRAYGNVIYVWSAMSLKFIAYDLDGHFMAEYPYASALHDFMPGEGKLFIYAAGIRKENVIDIYSLKTKMVDTSLTKASENHKLVSWFAVTPMCVSGDVLYYMSRDGLKVYRYDLNASEGPEEVCEFESGSFRIPDVRETKLVNSHRGNKDKYLNESSFVLQIVPVDKEHFKVMTSEGSFRREGKRLNDDERYFSIYNVSAEKSGRVRSFPSSAIDDFALISVVGNVMYFIGHSIEDEDDVYTLNRLAL